MEEEDVIFDTHAHYDDEAYEEDREDILKLIRQEGVGLVTDVGATIASTKKAVALSEQYDFIYAAVGVHPEGVEELTNQDMDWLCELAKREKVVAIGEIITMKIRSVIYKRYGFVSSLRLPERQDFRL